MPPAKYIKYTHKLICSAVGIILLHNKHQIIPHIISITNIADKYNKLKLNDVFNSSIMLFTKMYLSTNKNLNNSIFRIKHKNGIKYNHTIPKTASNTVFSKKKVYLAKKYNNIIKIIFDDNIKLSSTNTTYCIILCYEKTGMLSSIPVKY